MGKALSFSLASLASFSALSLASFSALTLALASSSCTELTKLRCSSSRNQHLQRMSDKAAFADLRRYITDSSLLRGFTSSANIKETSQVVIRHDCHSTASA